MGKVQPFCSSGLEDNILRPCCGLLSENLFIIYSKAPHANMSYSMKLLGNNDRFSPCKYCNFSRLSIKSPILVHALPTKFALGSELSELNQLILFPKTLICLILKSHILKSHFLLIITTSVKKCHLGKYDCPVLPKNLVFYEKMAANVVSLHRKEANTP